MMITDWNIVDSDIMREVLFYYVQDPSFENKILEIQRVRNKFERYKNTRYFLGKAITNENYPTWSNMDFFASMVDALKRITNVDISERLEKMTTVPISMCLWEDQPRIINIHCYKELPFLASPTFINMLGKNILSEEELSAMERKGISFFRTEKINYALALWFYKDNEGKFSFKEEENENLMRVYRIRSMDLETFEKATFEFIENPEVIPDYIKKDDLVLET